MSLLCMSQPWLGLITAFMFLSAVLPVQVGFADEPQESNEPQGEEEPQPTGNTFIPFPFYFYTPETKSGGGLALSYFSRLLGLTSHREPFRQ